jgi:hypothetical protein
MHHTVDVGELRAQLRRHGGALCLVGREALLAEGGPRGVEHHGTERWALLPAKTLRHMVAKPKMALVGRPADVARLLGIAKNARKSSALPSTRTSFSGRDMGRRG